MHHACADTTGALWSSRIIMVNPFSSVFTVTFAGIADSSVPVFGLFKWRVECILKIRDFFLSASLLVALQSYSV